MNAVQEMIAEYKRRRDWLIPELHNIKGFKFATPEGAFYAFVDVCDLLGENFASSEAVADHLLNEAQVVTTGGADFGADGFLRFSYATSKENLQTAVERINNLFIAENLTVNG